MKHKILREMLGRIHVPRDDYHAPSKGIIANWVMEDDGTSHSENPFIEMEGYSRLLALLPDKVVENLEKSRLAQDGLIPLYTAGLGYEELLSGIVADGTAIASSSTENFLAPAVKMPAGSLAVLSGNVPGKHIHFKGRGRVTTLTTAATLIYKFGAALTNVIPTTTWCVSGSITMDTTAQTNSQWFCEGAAVIRGIGSSGSVFSQGDAMCAAQALTIANQHADFMGSAGQDTPAAVTVDTTADQFLSLTGKWSLTTAYSIQAHIFMLEALN